MKQIFLVGFLLAFTPILGAETSRGPQMAAAAKDFSTTLSAEQKQKVLLSFDSPQRRVLTVIPTQRAGILRSELSDAQWAAAWKLIALGLSETGAEKVKKIMTWQNDAPAYTIAIWGEPSEKEKWGWRFEGHHASLSFEVEGDRARLVTAMLGANDLPILASFEEKSLALWQTLTDAQKSSAASEKDPKGFRRGFPPKLGQTDDIGIKPAALTTASRAKLDALLADFFAILPDDLAKAARPASLDDAVLTYRHEVAHAQFLFRLASPKFLVELETRDHLHVTLIPQQ